MAWIFLSIDNKDNCIENNILILIALFFYVTSRSIRGNNFKNVRVFSTGFSVMSKKRKITNFQFKVQRPAKCVQLAYIYNINFSFYSGPYAARVIPKMKSNMYMNRWAQKRRIFEKNAGPVHSKFCVVKSAHIYSWKVKPVHIFSYRLICNTLRALPKLPQNQQQTLSFYQLF